MFTVGLSDVCFVTEWGFRIISLLSREAHVRRNGKAIIKMLDVAYFPETGCERMNLECVVPTSEIAVMF